MTTTMTPAQRRKAERHERSARLRAEFEARVAAQDPNDPLTGDPYWNPKHPDYDPDPGRKTAAAVLGRTAGDETVPTRPTPTGNGTGRRTATPKQLHWLERKIAETRNRTPFILRIREALEAGSEIPFEEAKKALDVLFAEPRPNRYDGPCETCGANVPAGTGGIEKDATGRWTVTHIGECPTVDATIEVDVAPVPTGPTVDLSTLPAGSRGKLRVADPRHVTDPDAADLTRLKLQIDAPKSGKWAGFRFVKDAAEYGQGRRYGRQAPGRTYEGDAADVLARVVADPENALAAYGKLVGRCGVCNAVLEDETSVALGIGPICRAKAFG